MPIFTGYCHDEHVHPSDPIQNIFPHFAHVVERICTPHWHLAPARHRPHNLILIYDGEASFGCDGREFRGSPRDLIYFRAEEYRWAYTFPDRLMKCYAIDFYYTCPVWNGDRWELAGPPLPLATAQRIDDDYIYNKLLGLFDELTKVWAAAQPNRIMRCRSLFIEIINLLLLWRNGNGANFDQVKKVDAVIRFMTRHYAEPLTLEALSRQIRISPSYLGSIFRKITGTSPIDYLIGLRINKAKELLADGHGIAAVAAMAGFRDIFYFSKCFKAREGVSPTGYCKALLQKAESPPG
jgi:AraC-like DNA-binding protein